MALIRTDVTAVKLYQNFIFAGIGSYTNIFSKKSLQSKQWLVTLHGQKIYGFVPSTCEEKILCFGGKQFTVLNFSGSSSEIYTRLFAPVVCDDWLHSAVWVNKDTVALLTAHNTVQFWDTSSQSLLTQRKSKDNSILYSGLLLPLEDEVMVLAGTVFSEVIIHCCKDQAPLQHLKGHRGVIFSICCDPQKELIVTTSDDRSLRIWAPNRESKHKINTKEYWQHTEMVCKHELYGHSARVMRSCITNDLVVSVGEDGAICFWGLNGKILRKNLVHQNSCIWAVDADNDCLVTGSGDCGVMVHPLSVAVDYSQNYILESNAEVKKVVFTARRNIVMMTDDHLIYCNLKGKDKLTYELNHTSTYKLLSMSLCRQIIAVSDMDGNLDVFIENCKEDCLQNIIKIKLELGKILSMHWGDNRHLVLCSQTGAINVIAKDNDVQNVCNFVLPMCKERWLTAAAIDSKNNMTILGDRCGNIHIFVKVEKDPVKTFRKVHGRYGPTSITIKDSEIITTGRDGTVRYFSITNGQVKYMSSKCLEFPWVEKFLDRDENIICGFQERDFVVYDIRNNNRLLEVSCGGGHRSWDAVRQIDKINDKYDEFIKLIYIKNSDVNIATFQLSKIVSRNVVNGSHCKEINCLQCYRISLDPSKTFYVSGGEDTTLRVSSIDSRMEFVDTVVYKHLSNIRTLRIYPIKDSKVLLISAGGRAQICVNVLHFENKDEVKIIFEEVLDYQIRGSDKEKKGNQNWRNCSIDFDPETRVMDVEAIQCDDNNFAVFVGCSDAYLRIYYLKQGGNTELKLINEVKYHKTCILKTHNVKFENNHILATCTTRGEIALWDTSNFKNDDFSPFLTTTTNKSGINSIASTFTSNKDILIATGGDDNSIHLIQINVQDNLTSATLASSSQLSTLHSSQITGLCFTGQYLVSTSIDQRVSLLKWKLVEEIECEFVSQTFCDVTDVQGLELIVGTRCERDSTIPMIYDPTRHLVLPGGCHCAIPPPSYKYIPGLPNVEAIQWLPRTDPWRTRAPLTQYNSLYVANEIEAVRVCVYGKGMEVVELEKPS